MTASRAVVRRISRPDVDTATISLDGDVTYERADELLRHLRDQLAAYPATRTVRLDCGTVDHCDSWGLSVLLMAHRVTTEAGAHLRLENLPARLTRVLRITGTLEHLGGTVIPRQQGQGET